jgi:glycosyltransferase involved in cell wall biosynthesis
LTKSKQQVNSREIVVISEVFYPDTTSTGQLFSALLPQLSDEARLTVLCSFPTRHAERPGPHPRHEQWRGIEIVRCGLAFDKKKSLWRRAAAYMTFLAHVLAKLLAMRRPDVVFAVTNPTFLGMVVRFARTVRRFTFQYMLLDVYPEGLVGLGKLRGNSVLVRLWQYVNGWTYRGAAAVPVLGRDMRQMIHQRYAIPPERLPYIPHWSVAANEAPLSTTDNPMIDELGLRDKFIVQYSGNMGIWHDMPTLVRAAAQLTHRPDVHFLFIGDGVARAGAQNLARELGLGNITWLDYQPKEKLPISLTCCHLSLISMKAGLEGVAVPCKFYGILASGRGVLAQVPAESEIAQAVRDHACGQVIEPGDPQGLAQAIEQFADNPPKVQAMGDRALAAYRQHYTVEAAAEAFRALWGIEQRGTACNTPEQATATAEVARAPSVGC